MQARFTLAVLLGVVLLAAAACSSGGDDERIAELETDLEASEEALERERQAREAAKQEAAEAKQRADDAEGEAADAKQRADDAAEEIADAAEEIADAEEEIADAKDAQQAAEQGRRQAQQQQQQLQQQLTEAEQAELRARASSFGAVLDLETGGADEEGSATVSWTRGNNLTFRPAEVTTTRGSAAPSVPGGWRSAGFTGQTGTATTLTDETVYLYTNIQPPSSRAFWKVHLMEVTDRGLEVAASAVADLISDADNNDPTPTAAARYIPHPTDNRLASGVQVRGTYDGVSGTFTCTVSGTCTGVRTGDDPPPLDLTTLVGAPVDGVRSFVAGTGRWSFEPGSITTRVKAEDGADQDDAYLYFGVWSSIPDDIIGTYNFRYVFGGGAQSGTQVGNVPALANFDALVGPATFSGGAVGKYVTQGQVGGQNAKIGTFTATATLNAHFGNGTEPGTLSGSITDFREGGSPLAGWRVTMGGGGDTPDVGMPMMINTAAAVTGGLTVANIGGLSVGGSWGANFYGSDNEILADRDKYPASRYPVVDLAGVAGWFDATGPGGTDPNDASLAGAFAATPQ